jgi:hypothetical protein
LEFLVAHEKSSEWASAFREFGILYNDKLDAGSRSTFYSQDLKRYNSCQDEVRFSLTQEPILHMIPEFSYNYNARVVVG